MKRCPKCFSSIRRMGHIEKPFYCPECKEWFSNEEVTSKPTNADRIRYMTDEELALFLRPLTDCVRCYAWDRDNLWDMRPCYTGEIPCKSMWLDWLKQEAEE